MHSDSTTAVKWLSGGLAFTDSIFLFEVSASTRAARVLSIAGASNNPVDICAGFSIAAVSFVTLPQLSPLVFRRLTCNYRRDARRLRRPQDHHQAPLRSVQPTSNAVRRRRSPSSSASYHSLNAVDRTLDTMLRLCDLRDGKTFQRGDLIVFARTRFFN